MSTVFAVTDKDTMEVAEMVLGKVNKELVTLVESLGVKAVGISGKDGALLNVEKKYSNGEDIGYVGNVTSVNPKIIEDLLEKVFFQLSVRLVWIKTLILTISMQTMRHVRSRRQSMQKNWHS